MPDSTKELIQPILSKKFSRRAFIKGAAEIGLGLATVFLFGCSTTKQPGRPSNFKFEPTPSPRPEVTDEKLPEINEAEIRSIAQLTIADFNRVLGLNVSEKEVISKIHLVNTLAEYQEILSKSDENYKPGDEIDRPAITTIADSPYGKSIFFYKEAIDYVSKSQNLPNTEEGRKARANNIEWITAHELAHWSSASYHSQAIHDLVYGKMVGNLPEFSNKVIVPRMVEGAAVKAFVNGAKKSLFVDLEEAEAFIIGEHVFNNRGRPSYGGPFPEAHNQEIYVQISHLVVLLRKLDGNYDQNLKTLARLRMEKGGREKFCQMIGQQFRVPPEDQLFFGLSVLYSIDVRDVPIFRSLLGL